MHAKCQLGAEIRALMTDLHVWRVAVLRVQVSVFSAARSADLSDLSVRTVWKHSTMMTDPSCGFVQQELLARAWHPQYNTQRLLNIV